MDFFEEAALRLKQVLRMTHDKDVAAVLGISARAWVGRKHAGKFPEMEVRALAFSRPELKIDVGYVLTGETQRDRAVNAVGKADRENAALVARARNSGLLPSGAHEVREEPPGEANMAHDELLLLEAYRAASPSGRHATLATAKAFAEEGAKARPVKKEKSR